MASTRGQQLPASGPTAGTRRAGNGSLRGLGAPSPAFRRASPPQALSMNKLQQITDDISDLTVAHELVLSSDFELQAPSISPGSLENRGKETLQKAFWDSLEKQLSAHPRAILLLEEIKEVEEALDMELIKQEAEHGALLDIHGLTTYVLGTMARLCVPIQGKEVGLQSLTEDPAQLLKWVMLTLPWEIFQVLGLMKMDMVNFTIHCLHTHLQDHSAQYEQKKFQELLDKLSISLDHTRVSMSPSQLPPHPAVSGPPASSSTTVPSLMSLLQQGYMNLLHWEPGLAWFLVTDTVYGSGRLQKVNQLTLIAAVLLVTRGVCGSTLSGSPGFVARLKWITKALLEGLHTRCEEALEAISDQVLQEVSRMLSQLGYPAFTTTTGASLKGQVQSITDKEQQIHSFLSLFISPDGQKSQNVFPKGLDPIQEELLEAGCSFGSVIHHNSQVGPYHSGILREVLLLRTEPDSDAGMDSF
ncbi:LOW QUALITY PROTEIN: T-complex protein 11 homolog [Podargus strigoides]